MKKLGLALTYLAAPLLPVILLIMVFPQKYANLQYLVPSILGCIAYTWLCLQVILAARLKFLDRAFGLDKLYRFHGYMAFVGILLALAHKQIEEALFGEDFATQIGTLAIIAFIGATGVSLAFMTDLVVGKIPFLMKLRQLLSRAGINYHRAVLLHSLSMLGVLAMFIHIALSSSFADSLMFRMVIGLYLVLTLAAFAYHRWLSRPEAYVVAEVIEETPDVTTIKLKPQNPNRGVLSYEPGQFAYVRFPGSSILRHSHPFTLSSNPLESAYLTFTIKALGPFTTAVKNTPLGAKAYVKGPYGRFSYRLRPKRRHLTLIAGGIGITPFLSMLRHMAAEKSDQKVLLVWGVRKQSDLVCEAELKDLQEKVPGLSIVTVASAPEGDWQGRTGYLDQSCIQGLIDEKKLITTDCDIYVCGPPVMTSLVMKSLKTLGVESSSLITEKFSL